MRYIPFILLLSFASLAFSQSDSSLQTINNNKYPKSFADIGMGVGPNYGILGFRTVLGYKGNGLLIGVGTHEGYTTLTMGMQFTYKFAFMSIAMGDYASYEVEVNGRTVDKGLLNGTILMFGGRINLVESKEVFLELGIGYAGGDSVQQPFGLPPIEENGVTYCVGVNYRIGKY
jgi:hypothetical protein